MASTPGGSLIDGAAGSNTTSGNGSRNAINGPHLRSRQLSSLAPARRSSRSTPNPYRFPPTTLGGEASGSYEKKRKALMEEAPHGIPEAVKVSGSAPLTPRDPNRTYSSKDGAKGRSSEHAMVGSARSSTKKRKCMPVNNYLSEFTPCSKGVATGTSCSHHSPFIHLGHLSPSLGVRLFFCGLYRVKQSVVHLQQNQGVGLEYLYGNKLIG